MEKKQIAIIGAGISGLLACKYVKEKGFNPIVFEARSSIGGVWTTTMETTKLQTPKNFYQFSDFEWPDSVTDPFPHHDQVLEYICSYAVHFNTLPCIKFNTKVISIDYIKLAPYVDFVNGNLWGGTGHPFSPAGKWKVNVQDALNPNAATQVYIVDFVMLCVGRYTDLPHIPSFPVNGGPEVFQGQAIHTMDYAAMSNEAAAQFIKGKRVTVVGFHKSAIDVATEVAKANGVKHPCTLLIKTVQWTIPEYFSAYSCSRLNRLTQLVFHKPGEGFFQWLLVLLLSPLLWIYTKLLETYLRWVFPLKKYDMIPSHNFIKQLFSCMTPILPPNFYEKVEEGSLVLKKSQSFSFTKHGLLIDGGSIETDIVIFATGYNSDEKLKNIFTSSYFQKCIIAPSPFYRECIHPSIPQLAILGYGESPATLYTTEMRTKWLTHFLVGNLKLPTVKEMEEDVMEWEKCIKLYAGDRYRRCCVSLILQIHCNDVLLKDMGCSTRRKNGFFAEIFSPYSPSDYKDVTTR